jgi:isoleucyl-tRNA synthetase
MTYPKVATGQSGEHHAVPSQPNFPAIEERVLAYWKEHDTFRKSVEQRDAGEHGENEFVFYDGPPFANGLPHYGHLLTGYVKDLVPRYQTMRGQQVDRRFGWDTHGLPAELEAEKPAGHQTVTQEITKTWASRSSTSLPHQRAHLHRRVAGLRHPPGALGRLRERLQDARHVDFMESVMWAFKTLYDKG